MDKEHFPTLKEYSYEIWNANKFTQIAIKNVVLKTNVEVAMVSSLIWIDL